MTSTAARRKPLVKSWQSADIWGMFLRKDFYFALACRDRRAALHLGTLCHQCGQLCRWLLTCLWNMQFGQAKLKNVQLLKIKAFALI